jgi:hypothetical protein
LGEREDFWKRDSKGVFFCLELQFFSYCDFEAS